MSVVSVGCNDSPCAGIARPYHVREWPPGPPPGPFRPPSAPPIQAPISRGHGKPPAPTYRLNPSRHGMTPRFQATGRTGTRRSVESPPAPTLPIESETQTRTSPSGVPSAKGTAILPLSTRESEMQFERGGDHVATPRRSTPINLGANPHDPGGFHPWASARR